MPTAPAVDSSLVAGLRLAVMRLSRRLRQQADGDGDVTASLLSALSTIERQGPLTLGELAAVERVQPPSMTRIVSRLEELGYVARQPDARDRRIARVQVTEDGRRFVARSRTRKNAYLAERLRRFDADELGLLEQALPLLERLVEDER